MSKFSTQHYNEIARLLKFARESDQYKQNPRTFGPGILLAEALLCIVFLKDNVNFDIEHFKKAATPSTSPTRGDPCEAIRNVLTKDFKELQAVHKEQRNDNST